MNYGLINDCRATARERLDALREYVWSATFPKSTGEVNNHIHTVYSFSPYTPAMAALKAREAGLEVAGSVDHDSIGGAEEMLEACDILGLGGVVGFELRVSFAGTPFATKKINNPDSIGVAYMTIQAIDVKCIPEVKRFLTPIREARKERTRRMTEKVNKELGIRNYELGIPNSSSVPSCLCEKKDLKVSLTEAQRHGGEKDGELGFLDFERDVLGRSMFAEDGEVTERHLLAAVAEKLIECYGKGAALLEGLTKNFGIVPSPKVATMLADSNNPHLLFDVLGVLKSSLLEQVFEQPGTDECIPVAEALAFAKRIGAVSAYAYLGDVGESPTGDKKAEKFEDDFIEPLFEELKRMGFDAVAYMPPRNTLDQLLRVQALCKQNGLMEISGVDINSSRQSFNCPEVLKPEFRHLVDTTWELVRRQRTQGGTFLSQRHRGTEENQ